MASSSVDVISIFLSYRFYCTLRVDFENINLTFTTAEGFLWDV